MINSAQKVSLVALAACSISLSNPAVAAKKDFCIQLSGSTTATYRGQSFTLPKAGKCVQWQGYCSAGCSTDNVQVGVACTDSAKTHVSFGLTTTYLLGNRQFDWVRLDLPNLTGNGNFNYLNIDLATEYTAAGGKCPTAPSVP